MISNLDVLVLLKTLAIMMIPFMVGIIWLLPRILTSRTITKIKVGSVMVSIFMVTIVSLIGNSSIRTTNNWFVVTLVAIIWGLVGFLIGAYFDVRQQSRLGAKYYQEFLRLRMHAVEYGFIGIITSLPIGITVKWIVALWGASFFGILVSAILGGVFGGFLGWVLGQRVEKNGI